MTDKEMIILVDEHDNEVGSIEKMEAHRNGGKLHRAFSIFVFNSAGELMLQQRAKTKHHWAGFWTNTCCSHPAVGESLEQAAQRRLQEEMGFTCPLKKVFSFTYRAHFTNGLSEYEFDHFFIGKYDDAPKPNLEEVGAWKWISAQDLREDIARNPGAFTPWFKIGLERVLKAAKKQKA